MNAEDVERAADRELALVDAQLQQWKARALAAEQALAADHGRVVVIRGDWRPRVERVHSYVRLEIDNGATALLDADAVRMACLGLGLELVR